MRIEKMITDLLRGPRAHFMPFCARDINFAVMGRAAHDNKIMRR
jgi:hypothetical protein